jgi:hypothetical protein
MTAAVNPTSVPVIKELKDRLAMLSLAVLGQHLWTLHIQGGSKPNACLCLLCSTARNSFEHATGTRPTLDQEREAMRNWAVGRVSI